LLAKYDAVIKEQLSLAIVVVVPDNDDTINRIHYIPHHAVIRRDKSTAKVRVEYDTSVKLNSPFFNECLYCGLPLHCKIFDILTKFKTHPVALVADIEKAFLTIQLAESDHDALQFL
uniref:Reverse transcriptase domain-containing protein n=1 Tax=Amphimedon queenslandica TaxID=400682 RepID=A0A1X7V1F5_AMPQE